LGASLCGLNSVCGEVGLFQGGCAILRGDLMVNCGVFVVIGVVDVVFCVVGFWCGKM
jgi:hypothetical protein